MRAHETQEIALTRLERIHDDLYALPITQQVRTTRSVLRFLLSQGGFPAFFKVEPLDGFDEVTYERYERLYRLTEYLVDAYEQDKGCSIVGPLGAGSTLTEDVRLLVALGLWSRGDQDADTLVPNVWAWVSLAWGYQQERQAHHFDRWEEELADISIEGA